MNFSKKMFNGLAITLLSSLSYAIEPYLVEENSFFRQKIDFSDDEDKKIKESLLAPPAEQMKFEQATVDFSNGTPVIKHRNRTLAPISYAIMSQSEGNVISARRMRQNGVNLFILDVSILKNAYRSPRDASVDKMFQRFAKNAEALLKSAPDASMIIRIWATHEGDDYQKLYPDDLLTDPKGNTLWRDKVRRANYGEKWQIYLGKKIRDFMILVGKSKYAPAVVGVYVGAMKTGEWWYWKDGYFVWDYSKVRQGMFRKFILQKYGEDKLDALQKQWKAKDREDLFRLPTPAERGKYRPTPNSRTSDFLQSLNFPITNAAQFFGGIIKGVSGRKLLAGMEILTDLNTYNTNGTIFIQQLLNSKDIDFLGGPSPYHLRAPGSFSPSRGAEAVFAKHKKFLLAEEDIRTQHVYGTPAGQGFPPATPQGSVDIIRRQVLAAYMRGHRLYLMEFGNNWFTHPAILSEIGHLNNLYEIMQEKNPERNAEIAIVSDQESQLYGNYFANPTNVRRNPMSFLGADHDFYELEDFLKDGIYDKYKLIIFMNICALSEKEIAQIEKLKSGKRTLVFFYNAGQFNLTRPAKHWTDDLSRITSMKILPGKHRNPGKGILKIAINSKNFEQVFGEKINYTTKEESKISPDAVAPVDFVNLKSMAAGNSVANVIIRDSEATTLGTAESESRFAIKQFPEWTSVYSASCEMPSQILRFIAKKAGCHIYNETGNVVFNRGNFVAVHVAHSGDIKIKFPGNETVVDVFGKTVIQPENCQITFRAEKGQTKLFVQDRNPDDLLKKISEKTKQSEKNRQEYSKKYPAPQPSPGYLQGIRYGRRPNQKFAGNIGFNRNNPFIPRVMLVSGPYDKDAELDLTKFEKAAKSAKYAPLPKVSLSLEDLWQPLERMANCKPEDPVIWTPYWTGDIWTMMNRFGIGKGQKGVFSFYLVAKEEKEVEIYLASDGKATLLMDEKLLQAKPGRLGTIVKLPVGKTQIRIVAENISGNDGFTIKIGEKVPKKGHARITANPKNVSVSILP